MTEETTVAEERLLIYLYSRYTNTKMPIGRILVAAGPIASDVMENSTDFDDCNLYEDNAPDELGFWVFEGKDYSEYNRDDPEWEPELDGDWRRPTPEELKLMTFGTNPFDETVISSLGIAEVAYTIVRWLTQYYYLTLDYDPYLASVVSQVIAIAVYMIVLNLLVKITRLYKDSNKQ